VSRFLDFAKPLELHPIPSDLREAVANATAQVRLRAEAKHVRLEALLPSDPIHCEIDPALLSVALLNLLQNAIDASPVDGVVSIKAHAANEAVRILVTDHGSGIAPDHLESIFNPFFTTKSEGTGLGLAIVSKIIDEHGGKIAVRSDPGKGTQFEVLLPAPKQT
jgi:signal transduction histidine kinase